MFCNSTTGCGCPCMAIDVFCRFLPDILLLTKALVFKKNLNASKPSEHPLQVEECLIVWFHGTIIVYYVLLCLVALHGDKYKCLV